MTYIDEFGVLEFKTSNSNQYFIATIPFDIILNPFEVYWTEIGDNELEQTDKIRKTEFSQDSDSVRVSFKSDTLGRISIVGATMDDHEKLAAKIEKRSVSLDDQVSTKKDDMNSNVVDVTPEDIIGEIMSQFDADKSQTDEVIGIYKQIKNKSSLINLSLIHI